MSDIFDDSQGWQPFHYSAADGLRLGGRKYGWNNHGSAMPVLCLPGLTRNAADFHDLALHLSTAAARPRRVLCLDYRGRGLSAWDRNWENYDVMTETDDVLAGLTAAGIGECAIVGTSRGALISMVLTAIRPGVLGAVVMNDAGPEIDGRGLVRIRSYVEKGGDFRNWADATEAVRATAKRDFPRWDDMMWAKQARRIFTEKDGRIVRRYDPKLMKTLQTINFDNPLPTLWPQFAALRNTPLLLIRGANSDLLAPETVDKMHDMHPAMETVTVPDQGHAPDLGTDALPERIAAFLNDADRRVRHAA